MIRILLYAIALSAILAVPLEGQIQRPTTRTLIRPGTVQPIQTIQVKDGVISLIGTHGRTVSLPEGTFKGPGGSSIIVVTGRITHFAPPATGPTGSALAGSIGQVEIQSLTVQSGQISLIGTNGRTYQLPDGTFMSSSGAKIVVQNRTISEVSGLPAPTDFPGK